MRSGKDGVQHQQKIGSGLLMGILVACVGCGGGGGGGNSQSSGSTLPAVTTPTSAMVYPIGSALPVVASPTALASPVSVSSAPLPTPFISPIPNSTVVVVPSVAQLPAPLNSSGVESSHSLITAAAPSLSPATPVPIPLPVEAAQSSDAFVDSIGVNIHLLYPDTLYVTQYEAFKQYLISSGIRHIRDGMVDTQWQLFYDHLVDLSTVGIHATLAAAMGLSSQVVQQYPNRVPGVIEAIEAPNEPDLSGGPDWVNKIRAYQQLLYAAVKSGVLTSRYPVYGPSLTTVQAYLAVGDLSAYMDYSNMHNYFGSHNPGAPVSGIPGISSSASDLLNHIQAASIVGGGKPMVATENGYCTSPNTLNSVPLSVQAKYVPRMFLVQWRSGVRRTLEYEFLDNGEGCDGGFGLIATANNVLSPKPSYYALSGLIAALQDPGGSFTPGSLAMQVVTSGVNVIHQLFEKRDGTYQIVLWQEVPSVDASGALPLLVEPVPVTITLAANPSASSLITFDPSGHPMTQALSWKNGQLQVMATDSISIITLKQ